MAAMFADDITGYVIGISVVQLKEAFVADMISISKWITQNNLVLNRKQSKIMLLQRGEGRNYPPYS